MSTLKAEQKATEAPDVKAPADTKSASANETPEAPAESETEAPEAENETEAPAESKPAPDENDPNSFYSREELLILHHAKRVSWAGVFKVCALRDWDIPSPDEMKVKEDKKAKNAKVNPFVLPGVIESQNAIKKRFTVAKRKKREKLSGAVATAAAAVATARETLKSAKEAESDAREKLATFDTGIIKSDAQIEYLDKQGEKRSLSVALSNDGNVLLSATKGKGSDASEPHWFAGHQYNGEIGTKEHDSEPVAFTVLKMNDQGKRIQAIRLDTLPSWYTGHQEGDIFEGSARAFFEKEVKIKRNLRSEFSEHVQAMTPTEALAVLNTPAPDASESDASANESDASQESASA